ncbi:hypothetical protein [Consotaella salsifontis]|nr:hypothetical protein [Consotaella salsifontis]
MSPRSSLEIVLIAAASLIAGCSEYTDHRDSITLGAGNAPAANLALQTENPFPPDRNTTAIHADGKRAVTVVKSYQERIGASPDAAASSAGDSRDASSSGKSGIGG